MKKKQIQIIIGIIILVIIFLGLHHIYVRHIKWILCANKIETVTVNKYAILSYIGQLICTVFSFVNLVLILVFFNKDRKYKVNEQIIITKTHWFTDLIYEKNIISVERFFEDSINIIKKIYSLSNKSQKDNCIKNKKAQFAHLSSSIDSLSNKFIGLVEIIDNELSKELEKLLENYQDELTKKLEKLILGTDKAKLLKECIETAQEYKKNFIRKLYTYNIELYE